MKILLLVVFLFNTSQAVFGQRLISGPKDLKVLVEVINRNNQPNNYGRKYRPGTVLNAKVTLQNTTNKVRKISIMTCNWDVSWVSKGNYRFGGCGACDSNYETSIIIPAGQSLVFYGTLYRGPGNVIVKSPSLPKGNQLGFMDFKIQDFDDFLPGKTVVAYWSNEFTGKLGSRALQPSSGKGCDYYLSKTGK